MSWMDSWSRPSKSSATPPPLYLTVGDTVPYCHSCGRVIGQRKSHGPTQVKYCSQRCRNHKPGPVDRRIETAFAKLLDGATPESLFADAQDQPDAPATTEKHEGQAGTTTGFKEKRQKKKTAKSKTGAKGDHRLIMECGTVEEIFFQRTKDPDKVYGRRKNRRARFVVEKPEDWRSVDMVDDDNGPMPQPKQLSSDHYSSSEESESEAENGGVVLEPMQDADRKEVPDSLLGDAVEYGYGGGKVRPPQAQNDVNGSVGGEKGWAERLDETDEAKLRRREGQRRAEEREMVRKAARRGCAFGFTMDGQGEPRKCEAVMKGVVVEASFAKGEWGIRWREKV